MESVWDYPRPPRLEPSDRTARVVLGGVVVAESDRALRVLETSHPPAIYLPVADVAPGALRRVAGPGTFCEFKGRAIYFDVVADHTVARGAAWGYPAPVGAYAALLDHVSFYPARMDACFLGDEQVEAQEGDFYGGWRTADIMGPFKGASGTTGW